MLASVPGFTINVAYIPSLFWKGVPGSCPFESVPRSANTKAERKAKQTSTWEVTLLVVLLKVKKIQFTECNKKSKYKSTIRQVHGRQLCSSSFCGGIVLVAASLHSLAPPPTHHPLHDFGFHCATLNISTNLPAWKYLNHQDFAEKMLNQGQGGSAQQIIELVFFSFPSTLGRAR